MNEQSMLRLQNVNVFYGEFQALRDINLQIELSQCASIVGANGAGKSTLMQTIMGSLDKVSGQIFTKSKLLSGMKSTDVVRQGIAIVPEGRRLFPSLSVEENLLIGADVGRPGQWNLTTIYKKFPRLKERSMFPATLLSGGEQQMVAIGRALMTNPTLLLCDELSLGLSPLMVQEIYKAIEELKKDGVSILLVEQDLSLAIKHTDYIYCMREGEIVLEGKSQELHRNDIKSAYFGLHHD